MADKDKKLKIKKSSTTSDKTPLPDLTMTPELTHGDGKDDARDKKTSAEKDATGSALKIKKPAGNDTPEEEQNKDATGSVLKIKKPGAPAPGQASQAQPRPIQDPTKAKGTDSALKIKKPAGNDTPEEEQNKDATGSVLKIKKPGAPAPGQASQAQPRPIEDPTKKTTAPAPGQASQAQPRPIQDPTKAKGTDSALKIKKPAGNDTPEEEQSKGGTGSALKIKKPGAPAPGQASQVQPRPVEDPTKQTNAPASVQQLTPPPQPAPQQIQPPQQIRPPQTVEKTKPPPQPKAFPAGPNPTQQQPPAASQAPVFPTQQYNQGPSVPADRTIYQHSSNQGPVFPTNTPDTNNMGRPLTSGPPGTLSPAVKGKSTSPPLSAIMGEVKAAKKINNIVPKKADEVIKVKKPSGGIVDSRGNEFCLIPKDNYYLGIENDLEELEAAFTLARFPVTKKDYFEFLNDKDINYSSEELNKINKISPYPNCPAVMVSWDDAKLYCRWLREKTGEYYALPTAKEWECAARGKDGRIYPWGEIEPNAQMVCYNDQILEPQTTCSVDYFQKNLSPFGCVGMIGNVMEWTLDSFDDDRDPHILKGGSWVSTIDFCNNITPCMSYPPNKRQEFVGLRLLYLPKDLYKTYRESHS